MGCDIHAVFQSRQNGAWTDIDSNFDEPRHYQLFAVLAGVRNGRGFAGIRTGEPVKPIVEPRGLPKDFEVDEEDHNGKWMGDHSHSWLLSDEMINWANKAPTVIQTGILSREQYNNWDKESHPESYCGGVSGPGVLIVNDNPLERDGPNWSHVRCEWNSNLAEELAYFFDEIKCLHAKYGTIRMVFGFDS